MEKVKAFTAPPAGTDLMGYEVQDDASGLKGTVMLCQTTLDGNLRYGVQPKGFGLDVPKMYMFDVNHLTVTGKGLSDKVIPVSKPTSILPGEEVKHRITGMQGIATECIRSFSGCEHLVVKTKSDGSLNAPDKEFTDFSFLVDKIGPGITEQAAELQQTPRTGGPSCEAPKLF
jgi:hypothetical protein